MSSNGKINPRCPRMALMPDVRLEYTSTGHHIWGMGPCHRQQIISWTLPRSHNLEAQQYRGKAT